MERFGIPDDTVEVDIREVHLYRTCHDELRRGSHSVVQSNPEYPAFIKHDLLTSEKHNSANMTQVKSGELTGTNRQERKRHALSIEVSLFACMMSVQ